MLTDFGAYLRAIRLSNREKARDMAERMKISTAYLSAMENGKRKVSSEFIDKLCDEYDLELKQKKWLTDNSLTNQNTIKVDLASMSEESKKVLFSLVNKKLDKSFIKEICKRIDENMEEDKD